jgi:hypothetical protein
LGLIANAGEKLRQLLNAMMPLAISVRATTAWIQGPSEMKGLVLFAPGGMLKKGRSIDSSRWCSHRRRFDE